MKFTVRPLVLALALLGTTFCSKDHPTPNTVNSADAKQGLSTLSDHPLGFDPNGCGVDATGVQDALVPQARQNAADYGARVDDDQFYHLQEQILHDSDLSVDAAGHVNDHVLYASRINGFTDAVNAQLTEYQNYVNWAASHGDDVENPEDLKNIIRETFGRTIPPQPNESLSPEDEAAITTIASSTKAQLGHAFDLFDALYACEKLGKAARSMGTVGPENAGLTSGKQSAKHVSFKDFLQLRKQGKINPAAFADYSQVGRGFWSSLVRAVHIVVTVVVYTAVGAAVGFAAGSYLSAPGAVVGGWLGGALGFTSAIINIRNGICLFGRC